MKDALSQFRKVLSLSFFDLKFFKLIFENRSMTAAAKSLDITVSAASHRLSSLRETFDDVLFVRSQPNMVPTSKAHELYPVVCEILGQLERLTAPKEFNPHSLRRTFRVGCVDNALLTVLRRFVEKFYEMAPHCHLEFQPINKNLFKRLEEGKLDAAILPSIHELPPNIREMFLYENAFCLCVRKGHPLIEMYRQKGELTPEDLRPYKRVVISHTRQTADQVYCVDERRLATDAPLEAALSTPYFLTVPPILAKSDFIALLPRDTAETLSSWPEFPIEAIPYTPPSGYGSYYTRLIWHERTDQDVELQWFRGLFSLLARKAL